MPALYAALRLGPRVTGARLDAFRRSVLRYYGDFRDTVTNALAAPTEPTFTVYKPDGSSEIFAGASVQVEQVGIVYIDFEVDQAGDWVVTATSAGTTRMALTRFRVQSSEPDVAAELLPSWVDASSGLVVTPSGQPITVTLIPNLPALGALAADDVLPGVRGAGAGRFTGRAIIDAGAAAGATQGASAGAAAGLAAVGQGILRVSISEATALTAELHGSRWLVLTEGGHQLSLAWDATGDEFSCTVTNLTTYWCRPSLSGFTEAVPRNADLGIRPGGTAVLFCIESGADRLALLEGAVE